MIEIFKFKEKFKLNPKKRILEEQFNSGYLKRKPCKYPA
jgi:hypothetical protein